MSKRALILAAPILFAACAAPDAPTATPQAPVAKTNLTAGDADMDGVSDEAERDAGTDPNDSADAPAWHPELTAYPRSLFGSADKDAVKARFQRTDEPFYTLASRIKSTCSRSPAAYDDPDGFDQAAIYGNMNIAKSCAFQAYINADSSSASKAMDILEAMPSELNNLNDETFDNTDIHAAEALSMAAQAYDLLRGSGLMDSGSQSIIESNILGLSDSCYSTYVDIWSVYYKYQNNNHKTKLATALGLVGIVLNQNYDAAKYVSYAMTELNFVVDMMTTSEGGWAEGTYYLNYSFDDLLPFFIAYHRFAQGSQYLYTNHCDTQARVVFGCKNENIMLDDWWNESRMSAVYEWWLSVMMPDGYAPNFDDANRNGTFLGIIAGMKQSGYYRAAWERNKDLPYYSVDCADLSLDSLVYFPDTISATWPSWKSSFRPDAGTATFRSGWEDTARYLMLLAENGTVKGYSHEQNDGNSFMFHAYGEYLLIDPGYGSWSQREEVNQYEDHNVVLIDGNGPEGSPMVKNNGAAAYIENCSTATDFERCDGSTHFESSDFVRSVYFVQGSAFAIVDRLTNDNGTSHEYTALFQTNGGGDTGGTLYLENPGFQLTRSKGGMTFATATTQGEPVLDQYIDSYSPSYGQIKNHSTVTSVVQAENITMLHVLDPRAAGSTLPTATRLLSSNGAAALKLVSGSTTTIWIATDPGATVSLSSSQTGTKAINTDADFAVVRFDGSSVTFSKYEGGTYLNVN